MSIKITISKRNHGQIFWWNVDLLEDRPAALGLLLRAQTDSVRVSEESARQILRWCVDVPGWADGFEDAPHPLDFQA